MFGFPKENCFDSALELSRVPKFADAVINGTMDEQHVETSIPLLKRDMICFSKSPLQQMKRDARACVLCKRKRQQSYDMPRTEIYAVYLSIKERVASGEIGDIINIQTCEHVSYHHLSTSYVRGNGLTPMFATHLCYLQNAATI